MLEVKKYESFSHQRFHCFLSNVDLRYTDWENVSYSAWEMAFSLSLTLLCGFSACVAYYIERPPAEIIAVKCYHGVLILSTMIFIKFAGGLLVVSQNLNPEISRKGIQHFVQPLIFDMVFAAFYRFSSDQTGSLSAALMESTIILFEWPCIIGLKALQQHLRTSWLPYFYLGMIRGEDEPYSLVQLHAQLVIGVMLQACMEFAAGSVAPFSAWSAADGLSTLVGKFLGHNKYTVIDLLAFVPGSSRQPWMVRTLEGSTAFFNTYLIYTSFLYPGATFKPILYASCIMTVVEAVSPHSFDNPFLQVVSNLMEPVMFY